MIVNRDKVAEPLRVSISHGEMTWAGPEIFS